MLLVKKLCHDRYMKQVELSKRSGINQPTISKILNGWQKPYPKQAKAIALALGYDGNFEDLFKEVYE